MKLKKRLWLVGGVGENRIEGEMIRCGESTEEKRRRDHLNQCLTLDYCGGYCAHTLNETHLDFLTPAQNKRPNGPITLPVYHCHIQY